MASSPKPGSGSKTIPACQWSHGMQGHSLTTNRPGGQGWPNPTDEPLERALVAGLMLEAVLEAPGLPDDPQDRRRLVKSRLTQALVGHLSGRITLDRFRSLMHRLDHWFPFYYPLMPPPMPPAEHRTSPGELAANPAIKTGRTPRLVQSELLREWLQKAIGKILPQHPQRKLQPDRLEDFLLHTRGHWFRMKDLAQDFNLDRKTVWEYLQKLQEAGLLVHNQRRSAAVRYRLADRFLKVQVAALQRRVTQALAGLPQPQAVQVTEWLAATVGEPFWQDHWPDQMPVDRREEIIDSLKTAAILEVVCQSGERRMLRLARRWLWSHED